MLITELRLTVGRTIKIGNYENIHIEASGSATLKEDDEIDVVYDALIAHCQQGLSKAYAAEKAARSR